MKFCDIDDQTELTRNDSINLEIDKINTIKKPTKS